MGILFWYGEPELGSILSGYLGLALMGGSFIALGLLVSSTTRNQVVAGVGTFSLLLLALMATGLDQVTAFSAVAACINNLGPGLGGVGQHYADISDTAKWLLSFAMVLGRLEIFTLLVLLSPTFWRG